MDFLLEIKSERIETSELIAMIKQDHTYCRNGCNYPACDNNTNTLGTYLEQNEILPGECQLEDEHLILDNNLCSNIGESIFTKLGMDVVDFIGDIKSEPIELSELIAIINEDHSYGRNQAVCDAEINSYCGSSSYLEQNIENLPSALEIKTEECKLEPDAHLILDNNSSGDIVKCTFTEVAGTFNSKNGTKILNNNKQETEELSQHDRSTMVNTVNKNGKNENIVVDKNSNIPLDEVSDFNESDFEIEPFHPMELESETDEFIGNWKTQPNSSKRLARTRSRKNVKNNHKFKNKNDVPRFKEELKIVLKDILFDHGTNLNIVLKDLTVNLINDVSGNHSDVEKTTLIKRNNTQNESGIKTHTSRASRIRHCPIIRGIFPCTHCKQVFRTRRQVDEHLWKKHRNEIRDIRAKLDIDSYFTCHICHFITFDRHHLRMHKWTHGVCEKDKLLKCTECDYRTPNKFVFNGHLKRKHLQNFRPYTCKYCKKNFTDKIGLSDHSLIHHNDKFDKGLQKIFNNTIKHCHFCDFRTINNQRLHTHLATHSNVELLKCYNCNYETVSKSNLIAHVRKHKKKRKYHKRGDDLDGFLCSICNYKHFDEKRFQIHMALTHKRETDVPIIQYNCKYCNFATTLKKKLVSHCQRKHNVQDLKLCELCGKTFPDNARLANHLLRYHKSKTGRQLFRTYNFKALSCKICPDYKTTLVHQYHRHMSDVHQDDSLGSEALKLKFSCHNCDFKTAYKSLLQVHIRDKHTTHKSFECSYCRNQCFKHKKSLARHIFKEHRRELGNSQCRVLGYKINACQLCEYGTIDSMAFFKHQVRAHKVLN